MSKTARYSLIVALVVAAGLGYWASQNIVVRNLIFVLGYERTLDRYAETDTTDTPIAARIDPAGREANLVSAFYGLDDGLPYLLDLVACKGAGGQDGMPVIFSHEVDVTTLDPGDFKIVTNSGARGSVKCLTLAPADDPGELRTALLIGQFGSIDDQPVTAEITGNVLSLDGSLNFKGARVAVTPLENGPSLVWAENVSEAYWDLDNPGTRIPWGGGTGCPQGTRQVVRVTWDGGVSKPNGSHFGTADGRLYTVTVQRADGNTAEIEPAALADLNDGDNNHELCLDDPDPIVSVRIPAGQMIDPRNDLNAETRIALSSVPIAQ